MKKILIGLFMLVCLLTIVGCQPNPDQPVGPGGNDTAPTMEDYKNELQSYIDETIPSSISGDIAFEDYYDYEDGASASMTWTTSNGRTISSKGKYRQNLFDETIVLTATVNMEDPLGNVYDFEVSKEVQTKGSEDLEAYKQIIEGYLPDYVYSDFELVSRDGTFKGKNIFGEISYESSNPEVITSDGKYVIQVPEDTVVEFFYTVDINGMKVKGSKNITAEGKKYEYFTSEAINYLNEYFKDKEVIFENIEMPVTDDKDRVRITWHSSDYTVLSDDGILQTFEPNKEVTMKAEIKCYDGMLTWEKQFRTYNQEELLDFIVERMHRDEVQQFMMYVFAYQKQNNGFIQFFTHDTAMSDLVISTTANNAKINYLEGEHNSNVEKINIITGLKPWDSNGRPTTKKTSTDFITIHDTGSTQDAAWWNEYVSSGKDDRETSWHFTIDDKAVYQHVPLEEVAWHAGDGSAKFGLNDTGVKYTTAKPEITINDNDHYLYINGQKSNIEVPFRYVEVDGATTKRYCGEISDAGLYTCLGENGNYYMANVYASSYWGMSNLKVCTGGGNRNSVGIETCINSSGDYNRVMRNTANLVAHLLDYYGLGTDRVLQHRHFSDKLCPQVMIQNDMLDNFYNLIENEYIIRKYLSGVKFEYESNNPDLLANDGTILKQVNEETKVSYKVTVTFNGVTKTYEKITIIKPNK